MALLHRAELRPSKLELLCGWLPTRPWFPGDAAPELSLVAAYRLDDPDGEVGVETMLLRDGSGAVLQVPLTYRGAPLPGAEAWLVGTMEHSALGPRWAYDGIADPVLLSALATAVLTGGDQAELLIEIDGEVVRREPTMRLSTSGAAAAGPVSLQPERIVDADPAVVVGGGLELVLARRVGGGLPVPAGAQTLSATWDGQVEPVVLATVRSI